MIHYEFDLNEYLSHLENLVNIDSGSKDCEGVNRVAEYFKKLYEDIGWKVIEHNLSENVGSCLEVRNKDDDNIDILLIGHMDTVFKRGTVNKRPFKIEGNKAYGPGVMDMKSGLLSMYYGLRHYKVCGTNKTPSICVILNSDEEISSRYSKELIKERAKKSKYALILEPARANGDMVKERKGILKYSIDFKGVAAHAGVEPEKGISAITELGHWICELNKLNDLNKGTTVNVGLISGGSAPNVVAANANAVVDVRFKTDEEMNRIECAIEDLKNNPKLDGIKVNVNKIGFRPPFNPSLKSKKLYKLVDKIGSELGLDINWVATGGGSDANFTSYMGTPSVDSLGPMGGGAHGIDEYVDIDSIRPRLDLLINLILELA